MPHPTTDHERERRITRRGLIATAAAAALAARAGSSALAAVDAFPGVDLPPDLGQTDRHVFVPQTGHTVRGSMLDYWRANGGAAVYGYPISEPFAASDGFYSQAFETAIFQYRPEFLFSEEPIMRLMPIGQSALKAAIADLSSDAMTRAFGKALAAAAKPLDPDGSTAKKAAAKGRFATATRHSLTGAFLDWHDRHEGAFYLGDPISEPARDGDGSIQYFEGGALRHGRDGRVALLPLVKTRAKALGLDTAPVKRGKLPKFDEALFRTAENPAPSGDESKAGRRWLEISLGEQRLWAYQGSESVLTTLVSTGIAPNNTQAGLFHVRLKYPLQSMQGFTNNTGEVIGLGTDAPTPDAVPYLVNDVPNVLYFSLSAEALHGAYWHNNFGQVMSHGCVNLPLDVAAWMYGWAPLGTMIWIHE